MSRWQGAEQDTNFDGKPDSIHFTATVQSPAPVYGVKLLLQFSYQLQVRHSNGAAPHIWRRS